MVYRPPTDDLKNSQPLIFQCSIQTLFYRSKLKRRCPCKNAIAAKVLADNLASLLCACALGSDAPEQPEDSVKRQCNRGYAAAAMLRMLPGVLIFVGDVLSAIGHTLDLLRRTTCRIISGRSNARQKSHVKPHAQHAYKGSHGLSSVHWRGTTSFFSYSDCP